MSIDFIIEESFSQTTRPYLRNLINFFEKSKGEQASRLTYLKGIEPQSRLASVLVLLFEKDSKIRFLLTTRGKDLKVHGGKTSLPGGKIDEVDKGNVIATAYREANEEVNLPIPSEHDTRGIHTLGILELQPFHKLVVVPVVAFLTENSILDELKPSKGEVDQIFSHPVEAILDPELVTQSEEPVKKGSKDWPYPEDYHHFTDHIIDFLGGTSYRYHHFRSSASPVTGFTADVLIRAAEILYNRNASYERYAPDQLRNSDEVVEIIEKHMKEQEDSGRTKQQKYLS